MCSNCKSATPIATVNCTLQTNCTTCAAGGCLWCVAAKACVAVAPVVQSLGPPVTNALSAIPSFNAICGCVIGRCDLQLCESVSSGNQSMRVLSSAHGETSLASSLPTVTVQLSGNAAYSTLGVLAVQPFLIRQPSGVNNVVLLGENFTASDNTLMLDAAVFGLAGTYTIGFVEINTCSVANITYDLDPANATFAITGALCAAVLLAGLLLHVCGSRFLAFAGRPYGRIPQRPSATDIKHLLIPFQHRRYLAISNGGGVVMYLNYMRAMVYASLALCVVGAVSIGLYKSLGTESVSVFASFTLAALNEDQQSGVVFYAIIIATFTWLVPGGTAIYLRKQTQRIAKYVQQKASTLVDLTFLISIPKDITQEQLEQHLFAMFGRHEVVFVNLVLHPDTGASSGRVFVTFARKWTNTLLVERHKQMRHAGSPYLDLSDVVWWPAPRPEDVIWGNLFRSIAPIWQIVCTFALFIVMGVGVGLAICFFAVMGSEILQGQVMAYYVGRHIGLATVLVSVLPALATLILRVSVDRYCEIAVDLINLPCRAARELTLLRYVFIFQQMTVVTAPTSAYAMFAICKNLDIPFVTSFVQTWLPEIFRQSSWELLTENYGQFLFRYMLQLAFLEPGMQLMQLVPFLKALLFGSPYHAPRDTELNWATRYAVVQNLIIVIVMCGWTAPQLLLLLPVPVIMQYYVTKYQVMFSATRYATEHEHYPMYQFLYRATIVQIFLMAIITPLFVLSFMEGAYRSVYFFVSVGFSLGALVIVIIIACCMSQSGDWFDRYRSNSDKLTEALLEREDDFPDVEYQLQRERYKLPTDIDLNDKSVIVTHKPLAELYASISLQKLDPFAGDEYF
eukprot:TRINITY_DN7367_c0_g1_i1.p1 TRINITY_DN7367_c0_g1~~TRINITY_DN7367_c0_g1_i1.p1  ORF type:complete len:850 (+),score=179.57 TRINITY_DN7367_c0_g1_i1:273-2822(+)